MSDPEPCPCPICGGTMCNVPQRWAPEQWVVCHSCGTSGPTASGVENAIAAWNRRATPAEVEALRARVERQSRIMATLLQHAASAPLTDDDMAWARAQVAALEDRT